MGWLRNEKKRLVKLIRRRIYITSTLEKNIVDQFHAFYYDSNLFEGTHAETLWLGVRALKCPLDLWIYQEIIYELKPDTIIECGTAEGGSALFLASLCDLVNNGRVITIDTEKKEGRPEHKRIEYLLGSSVSDDVVSTVKSLVRGGDRVMVILDSNHRKDHVLKELKTYSGIITKGSYMIVEDTNINGHPVAPEFGPGPMEAVEEFLKENKDFVVDREREKFYLTFNPKGYLRKVR